MRTIQPLRPPWRRHFHHSLLDFKRDSSILFTQDVRRRHTAPRLERRNPREARERGVSESTSPFPALVGGEVVEGIFVVDGAVDVVALYIYLSALQWVG